MNQKGQKTKKKYFTGEQVFLKNTWHDSLRGSAITQLISTFLFSFLRNWSHSSSKSETFFSQKMAVFYPQAPTLQFNKLVILSILQICSIFFSIFNLPLLLQNLKLNVLTNYSFSLSQIYDIEISLICDFNSEYHSSPLAFIFIFICNGPVNFSYNKLLIKIHGKLLGQFTKPRFWKLLFLPLWLKLPHFPSFRTFKSCSVRLFLSFKTMFLVIQAGAFHHSVLRPSTYTSIF